MENTICHCLEGAVFRAGANNATTTSKSAQTPAIATKGHQAGPRASPTRTTT